MNSSNVNQRYDSLQQQSATLSDSANEGNFAETSQEKANPIMALCVNRSEIDDLDLVVGLSMN